MNVLNWQLINYNENSYEIKTFFEGSERSSYVFYFLVKLFKKKLAK